MNKTVFSTKWFSVIAKEQYNADSPYYVIDAQDCVSIIALTYQKEVLLVKQYRPTLNEITIELPSGHIEKDETPETAARRELLEETGYRADTLELFRVFVPETGRIGFRSWCFFAPNVFLASKDQSQEIIEVIKCPQNNLIEYIDNNKINNALDIAIIFLGIWKRKLPYLSLGGGI